MDDLDRFLHEALGSGDFAFEALRVDDGFALEIGQADVDPGQGLRNLIVKFAADLPSLVFLGGQNLVGKVTKMLLHLPGLMEKQNVVLLAPLQRGFKLPASRRLGTELEKEGIETSDSCCQPKLEKNVFPQ